jgi:cell division inhibitor SulA
MRRERAAEATRDHRPCALSTLQAPVLRAFQQTSRPVGWISAAHPPSGSRAWWMRRERAAEATRDHRPCALSTLQAPVLRAFQQTSRPVGWISAAHPPSGSRAWWMRRERAAEATRDHRPCALSTLQAPVLRAFQQTSRPVGWISAAHPPSGSRAWWMRRERAAEATRDHRPCALSTLQAPVLRAFQQTSRPVGWISAAHPPSGSNARWMRRERAPKATRDHRPCALSTLPPRSSIRPHSNQASRLKG